MKRSFVLILILFFPVCVYSQADPEMGGMIMQELKELQQNVTALRSEMVALRQELAAQKKSLRAKNAGFSKSSILNMKHRRNGADYEALLEIEIPDMSDRDAVVAYLDEIRATSVGQNSWSSDDPQHAMLLAVGEENVDLLLEALTGRHHTGPTMDYYIYNVLTRLATDEHKDMIIEYLPANRELVKVVYKMGWAEDAREILIEDLQGETTYLPTEWVKAVASFRDPATYEILSDYLIYGSNRRWTFEAVEYLPDFDLESKVAEAWSEVKRDRDSHGIRDFAPIAAEYGEMDAVEELIITLQDSESSWSRDTARRAISNVTDYRGPMSKIAEWYEENGDKLVFNKDRKRFEIKE